MIVAIQGAAGGLLITLGVFVVLGAGWALIAAGVGFLAGAYVTNLVLRQSADHPRG